MSLSVVGFFVADGSIDNRHQIFYIFVVEGARDNIPSFHMISEKYFKVGIVHVVDSHVDGVVLRAGIWGIFNLVEFYIGEVFNDLDFLDLPVLTHNVVDEGFVHLRKPRDEQLAN